MATPTSHIGSFEMLQRGGQLIGQSEWKTSSDWWRKSCFLHWKNGLAYNRSLQLFVCGCLRVKWHSYPEVIREAVRLAEACADRVNVSPELLSDVRRKAATQLAGYQMDSLARMAVICLEPSSPGIGFESVCALLEHECHNDWFADVMDDVIRDPFDPINAISDSVFASSTGRKAYQAAQECYYSGNSSLVATLPDLLAEAGFENPEIASHCQARRNHFRGCWVLDLILVLNTNPLMRALQVHQASESVVLRIYNNEKGDPRHLYR